MHGESSYDLLRFESSQADPLDVDVCHRLHGARPLDHSPLAGPSRHMAQQCLADLAHPRPLPGDDQHRQAKPTVQTVQIDDVEAGERNSLEHDELKVGGESRFCHEACEVLRRIRPIAPHAAVYHPFQPESGKHSPHDPDVATMVSREGAVVEADDVRKPTVTRLGQAAP